MPIKLIHCKRVDDCPCQMLNRPLKILLPLRKHSKLCPRNAAASSVLVISLFLFPLFLQHERLPFIESRTVVWSCMLQYIWGRRSRSLYVWTIPLPLNHCLFINLPPALAADSWWHIQFTSSYWRVWGVCQGSCNLLHWSGEGHE